MIDHREINEIEPLEANGLEKNVSFEKIRNRYAKLEPGDHMTIDGQYPPCTSCKGKMKARATQSGATIQYNWQEDGQQKTWMANPSKGCK
ncbi:hypothetical protein [Burkholderia orbicola]|uniref:hypothetical protein n=1 Tax=Burkholderia orbicola TaxID=2978683 RepID=UPI0035C75FCA